MPLRERARATLAAGAASVPGIQLARTYQRRWLHRDVIAGLVLTVLLIPQGMAYASLAGLPPVTGIYTTVLALLAYAAFGSSRFLVLGPDSALGPMIAAAILPLVGARGDPSRAVALASMLALLMGAFCIAAGIARVGVLAELFSKPVRIGFVNGIAVVVVVSQLPALFGFRTRAVGVYDQLEAFLRGLRDDRTVVAALALGIASLVVIVACRRWWPHVPGILIAVVGAAAVTAIFDLAGAGVVVVGAVPSGLPTFRVPDVSFGDVGALLVAAAGMAFVTLADSTALSRALAASRGDRIDANREIIALGAANAAAGLFEGFPVGASATRTAVAQSAGSRTQLAGVVGAIAIVVILLTEAGLGQNLPQATLAAIVIGAAFLLFDLRSLRWFWAVRRAELSLAMIALVGVVVLGALEGIVVAIVLSLGDFVRRAWRPYDAVLGRVRGRKGYHDLDRHPEAVEIPGLLLYRFDAPLFFANAELFSERVNAEIAARLEPTRWVVVAAEPITDIDTTGAEVLGRVVDDLEARSITLVFAELKGPVKDLLGRYGLLARIGEDRVFPTLGTAIHAYLRATDTAWTDWSDQDGDTEPTS
jgi:high affinity sulfate transporter 1